MPSTVLIMTYEFPPAGGGGVQRMAKFARYLPEFGWDPVVLTSEPARGRPLDDSLLADVAGVPAVRLPARNVSALMARPLAPVKKARGALRRGPSETGSEPAAPGAAPGAAPVPSGGASEAAPTTAGASEAAPTTSGASAAAPAERKAPPVSARLARLVSMDDAAWWARNAQKRGVALGRQNDVAAVLASGPPFSVLVAGQAVARGLGVPLVADMRDGWRDNPAAWYPSAAARRRALQAELAVLAAAAVVLTTSPRTASEALELGGRDVRVLPNGFDSADIVPWAPQEGGPLRLVFMGKMYGRLTEPWQLFEALARVAAKRPDLEVRLEIVGDAGEQIRAAAERHGLSSIVDFAGYLPHAEAVARVASSDVALTIIADRPGAKAMISGKLFEYLAVGLPTLALAPVDGDAARLITSLDAGWSVAPHDVDAIAARVIELADDKRGGVAHRGAAPEAIARYERRALAGQLAEILGAVVAPAAEGASAPVDA